MAVYHFSVKVASRSAGKSAIAMAAMRSGQKLKNERTGRAVSYEDRHSIAPDTLILAPDGAPDWAYDRNRLWNEVERIEKRKDAQLCREITVALPREFSATLQRQAIESFCKKEFVARGMVADIAIHRADPNNPHAHIMLTMRPLNDDGVFGAKAKMQYVLDEQGNKIKLASGRYKTVKVPTTDWDKIETLVGWRKAWADHINGLYAKANRSERIDHRSLKEQATGLLSPLHESYKVRQMEKRGIRTKRGEYNRALKAHNARVIDFQSAHEVKLANEEKTSQKAFSERRMRNISDWVSKQEQLKQLDKEFAELEQKKLLLYRASREIENVIVSHKKGIELAKEWGKLNSERFKYQYELDELKPTGLLNRLWNKNRSRIKELEQIIERIELRMDKLQTGGTVQYHTSQIAILDDRIKAISSEVLTIRRRMNSIEEERTALQIRSHVLGENDPRSS